MSAVDISNHHFARTDHWRAFFAKVLDAMVIILFLAFSVWGLRPGAWDTKYTLAAIVAAFFFFLLAEVAGLYRPWRRDPFSREFLQIILTWGHAVFFLLLVAYAIKTTGQFSRLAIGVWLAATPFFLGGWRIVGRAVSANLTQNSVRKRIALVWGAGELGKNVVDTIQHAPWLGMRIHRYIEEETWDWTNRTGSVVEKQIHSNLEAMEKLARQGEVDIVYIALPSTAKFQILNLIDRLADTTVSVYMVPDFFTTSLFHGFWSSLEGIPVISVFDTPFLGVDRWIKRTQDVALSLAFLLVMALPMALLATAIKLSSPGPAIFKQKRYGIDGKPIRVWKFRTMAVCEDGDKVSQAKRRDPRVTRLGALLRRTSLDELPQFINVLKGEMSIVGPRPHAVTHNEQYRKMIRGYMLRHAVKPGITGWAQINGWRGETDKLYKMQKRVEHDLWYIRNWSFWLDIKIILLTALRGVASRNAY